MQSYWEGNYIEAQRRSRQIAGVSREERVRTDAALVHAIATLRLPSRNDRLDGRGELKNISERQPEVMERAEVQLAYGLAQAALSETGSALFFLDGAAQKFQAQSQPRRAAEALLGIIRVWSAHAEWQFTPPQYKARAPISLEDATALRREQMAAARARIAALHGSEHWLTQADVFVGNWLLTDSSLRGEGLALLAHLCEQDPLTPDTADACLALAEARAADGEMPAAEQTLRRVASGQVGDRSNQAADRLAALRQPYLDLRTPSVAAPGESLDVTVSARGFKRITVELRRVDLAAWLHSRQGRFAEGALPTEGSVIETREIAPAESAAPVQVTLTASPPTGAFVVVARGALAGGAERSIRRLLLVSNLRASVWMGSEAAVIWADSGSAETPRQDWAAPQAQFWMHGSFVATQPVFDGSIGRFPLPAESRVLRDKRWVCLVRAGAHLALCEGRLPADSGSAARQSAVLVTSPIEPRPGEPVDIAGFLLSDRDPGAGERADLLIELVDGNDRVVESSVAPVNASGAFQARLALPENWTGNAQVRLRRDQRTIELLQGSVNLRISGNNDSPLLVETRTPRRIDPGSPAISARIRAAYPWGVVPAGASANVIVRGVRLPVPAEGLEAVPGVIVTRRVPLDTHGRGSFSVPVSELSLPPGPLAIGLWTTVSLPDGRAARSFVDTLVHTAPFHQWMEADPPEPRVGEPLRLLPGWFDPQRRALAETPDVLILRDDEPIARLPLVATLNGLSTAPWIPMSPGRYTARATLPLLESEPLRCEATIEVAAQSGEAVEPGLACSGEAMYRAAPNGYVLTVRLDGGIRMPLLVLLEDGQPLAARSLEKLDGRAQLEFPIPNALGDRASVLVAVHERGAARVLAAIPVLPETGGDLRVSAEPEGGPCALGAPTRVRVRVEGLGASGGALLARLIYATQSGYVQWLPGRSRGPETEYATRLEISDSGGHGPEDETPRPPPAFQGARLAPQMLSGLFEGTTLWSQLLAIESAEQTLEVQIPNRSGWYKLIVLARAADGRLGLTSRLIDARDGIELNLDVPPLMSLGDRTLAAIELHNRSDQAARVEIDVRPGPGLEIESLTADDRAVAVETAPPFESAVVQLQPGADVRLLARFEAAAVGEHAAHIEARSPYGTQERWQYYSVRDVGRSAEAPVPQQPTIVRRSLFLLEQRPFDDPLEPGQAGISSPRFELTRVDPDQSLPLGQLLLVRDEFELSTPLGALEWTQDAPSVCVSRVQGPGEFRRLPGDVENSLRQDKTTSPGLPVGPHIQETAFLTVRPGVAGLPAPRVRVNGLPLAITIETRVEKIVVREPE